MAENVQNNNGHEDEVDDLVNEIEGKANVETQQEKDEDAAQAPSPQGPEAVVASESKQSKAQRAQEELESLPSFDNDDETKVEDGVEASTVDEATTEETEPLPTTSEAAATETIVPPLSANPTAGNGYEAFSGGSETPSHAEPEKKSKRGKHVRIAVGAVVAGLAAVYVGGSIYFSSHFMPGTTVNGQDVSGMSSEQLASSVTDTGNSYTTTVSGDNLSIAIKGSDIDLSYDGDSYASDAMSQSNPWAWPAELLETKAYAVEDGISYDQQKLSDLVSTAVDALNQNASQPTNATITYNSDTKQFEVVPEQYGTAVDKDSVLSAVEEGVSTLSSSIELGQDQLVQPSVKSDDATLAASVQKANELVQLTIPLDVNVNGNDTQVAEVTPDMIAGWLTVDDQGNISVNTDAIKTWTQGDLSTQLDSVGTSRTYTRADGKEVTVSGGTYGWSIDGASLADTIGQQILDANASAIDIPMKSSAAVWNPGGAEWTSYIDVDLSEQHARYYDDSGNILWESDFVSGNPNLGNSTPTGVYSINSNMQSGNVELRGLDENGDGEPDYISYVTYWMPFVDNLVAFHDASWRGSFGGSIYTYDGSHGCVNLPSSAAQQLYGMVSVGTVVVVHN